MRELFTVDNISYEFIGTNNSIAFSIRRGASKLGVFPPRREKYSLIDADDYQFDDLNLCLSPFKVFEKVIELSLKWIRSERPSAFTFGTRSKRKGKVYEYLVDKTLNHNPDIRDNYFCYKGKSGGMIFYRKFTKPNAA